MIITVVQILIRGKPWSALRKRRRSDMCSPVTTADGVAVPPWDLPATKALSSDLTYASTVYPLWNKNSRNRVNLVSITSTVISKGSV